MRGERGSAMAPKTPPPAGPNEPRFRCGCGVERRGTLPMLAHLDADHGSNPLWQRRVTWVQGARW